LVRSTFRSVQGSTDGYRTNLAGCGRRYPRAKGSECCIMATSGS
jgi:hypothetical protein